MHANVAQQGKRGNHAVGQVKNQLVQRIGESPYKMVQKHGDNITEVKSHEGVHHDRIRQQPVFLQRVYLEHGDKFDWPDLSAEDGGDQVFCYGLRDQIGVLCDGTVVPCCLDHEGDLALGNLLEQDLAEILESPRARAICHGFAQGVAAEELCRKCGYARRFG